MPSPTIINDLNILMDAKIEPTIDMQQGLPYLPFLPKVSLAHTLQLLM